MVGIVRMVILVPNWYEQYVIDYMRDLFYGYGYSGYKVSKILNDLGERGKLGGIWRQAQSFAPSITSFMKNQRQAGIHQSHAWGIM